MADTCGHTNPVGTKFCSTCGAKIQTEPVPFCTNCSLCLEEGTKFCPECGQKVLPPVVKGKNKLGISDVIVRGFVLSNVSSV